MKNLKILPLMLLPVLANAQKVANTDSPPVHVARPLSLPAYSVDLGLYIEAGAGPEGICVGVGAYEKALVGNNFLAQIDAQMSSSGKVMFTRIRGALGYRQKSFYVIAILPQFVQRNFNEYSTPPGAEIGLDRKVLRMSLACDFYNDRPVFYFRARLQLKGN